MSISRLETDLLMVKKDLQGVKQVNNKFFHILEELNGIKERTISDPKARDKISEEFKEKEIIDIFASIEEDFRELKRQMTKQEIYKERVVDFVESLRTKKRFSFEETTKSILFLEEAIDSLDAEIISLKPEYIGTIDLGEVAIALGLHKDGSGIVVQRELFSNVLAQLIAKRIFKNIIFETDNAKIFLKNSTTIIVESNNHNIRKLSHLD